jgi:hypothetical protein
MKLYDTKEGIVPGNYNTISEGILNHKLRNGSKIQILCQEEFGFSQ